MCHRALRFGGRRGPVGAHPDRGHYANAGWLSAVRLDPLYTIAKVGVLLADLRETTRVGLQRRRDRNRTVLLLAVFDDRDERASDGEPRSVERVDEVRLACPARPELDVGPARLEGFGVAAGRNLGVRVAAREPHLDVVRLGRRVPEIRRAVFD